MLGSVCASVPQAVLSTTLIRELELEWQKELLVHAQYETAREEMRTRRKADRDAAALRRQQQGLPQLPPNAEDEVMAAHRLRELSAPWYLHLWWRVRGAPLPPYAVTAPRPSLAQALMRTYRTRFLEAAVFQALIVCLQLTQPMLLRALVDFIIRSQAAHAAGQDLDPTPAWIYCCGMFLCPCAVSMLNSRYQRIMQVMGIQLVYSQHKLPAGS
jgi:hypothetical protein